MKGVVSRKVEPCNPEDDLYDQNYILSLHIDNKLTAIIQEEKKTPLILRGYFIKYCGETLKKTNC